MTEHEAAGHVSAALRALPADSADALALVARLRNHAARIAQPLADALGTGDLTELDAVVALSLLTGGESGESGEDQATTRVSAWRTSGESWRISPPTPRQRAAVRLLRACTEAMRRGRVDPWLRDWIVHELAGIDADRDLGARTRAIRVAAGRKGTRARRGRADKLAEAIAREAARLTHVEARFRAAVIARKLGVHPATVRKRLK
jgi:hypothetical protein